jgi:hypothetical protein
MRRWRGKRGDWAGNRGLQPAFSGFSVTQKACPQLSQFLPALRHSDETSNGPTDKCRASVHADANATLTALTSLVLPDAVTRPSVQDKTWRTPAPSPAARSKEKMPTRSGVRYLVSFPTSRSLPRSRATTRPIPAQGPPAIPVPTWPSVNRLAERKPLVPRRVPGPGST